MGRHQDARRRQKIIEIGLGPRTSSLRLPYFFRSWASRMKISREAPDVSDGFIRVGLTGSRRLPVYPGERTLSG